VSDLVENLKKSAAERTAMVKRFGLLPVSILKLSRGKLSKEMHCFQTERPERGRMRLHEAVTEEGKTSFNLRKKAGLMGGVVAKTAKRKSHDIEKKLGNDNRCRASADRLQASTMPAELVEFFIKYYARPGDTYVDPFMGQGVQMQVAHRLGLHYYGYDVSAEFFEYIKAVRDRIDNGTTTLSVTLGDSRFPTEVPDRVGDFSFHSPPYWDIEYYGDEPAQLGTGQTYADFLVGMEDVARAWLPKHKPGAYHVVNTNDFRRDKRFYPYHSDIIALYQRAGWYMHDIWVIDGLVGGLPRVFAVQKNKSKVAPKVHEYAMVFRAPA